MEGLCAWERLQSLGHWEGVYAWVLRQRDGLSVWIPRWEGTGREPLCVTSGLDGVIQMSEFLTGGVCICVLGVLHQRQGMGTLSLVAGSTPGGYWGIWGTQVMVVVRVCAVASGMCWLLRRSLCI